MTTLPSMNETVDPLFAANMAQKYLGSFKEAPHDVHQFSELLIEWMVGKKRVVIQRLCDPGVGAVAKSGYPSIKAVNAWYDDWTGRAAVRGETKKFRDNSDKKWVVGRGWTDVDWAEPSLEEREANLEKIRLCRLAIQSAVKHMDISKAPPPKQGVTDGQKLLDSLKNLEDMRMKASGVEV